MRINLIPDCNFYEIICICGSANKGYYYGKFIQVIKKYIRHRFFVRIKYINSFELSQTWEISKDKKVKQFKFQVMNNYGAEIKIPLKTYSKQLRQQIKAWGH